MSNQSDSAKVGHQALLKRIADAGIGQTDLARRSDLSATTVGRVLSGDAKVREKTLNKLIAGLTNFEEEIGRRGQRGEQVDGVYFPEFRAPASLSPEEGKIVTALKATNAMMSAYLDKCAEVGSPGQKVFLNMLMVELEKLEGKRRLANKICA